MSEIDVVRQIAQQVLTIPTLTGGPDNWLWDRTLRIVRNVEHICRLPEIAGRDVAIDRFCLIGAAYFCDAGFARYADAQDPGSRLVLADVTPSDLRDFSSQVVTDRLTGSIPGPRIDKINQIINASADRDTEMIEAMVLSDARNLDDMGAVGLFNEFRRYTIHGKGVSDVLESWKRKVDYEYWPARLRESFRFESVRTLAQRRLAATEAFMSQRATENTARDLEELIIESLDPAAR